MHSLTQRGLRRKLPVPADWRGTASKKPTGLSCLNFSSNDYLGLSSRRELVEASERALRELGAGSGASRLVSGNLPVHVRLEERLAAFKGTEAALCFSSGYAAAMGTIPALVSRDDIVIMDKLSHACLVDAARLSGAVLRVFPHNDMQKLERLLRWSRTKRRVGSTVLVVTESVFSMDGDVAPLLEIVKLAEEHDAMMMVDEAHGMGVLGPRGRGLAAELGLTGRIAVHMGTLSKAFGSAGGYIAGSALLVDLLINSARSFIYSTAPPPAVVAAALAAVDLVDSMEGEKLIQSLHQNIALFERLCGRASRTFPTPILPVIVGGEGAAVEAARVLLDLHGLLLPAIRYPTVARGRARLRVSLRADHTPSDIGKLVEGLAALNLL